MRWKRLWFYASILLGSIFFVFPISAQEFSAGNFIDFNPVITVSGGISTSTNFQLISGTGQTVVGESTSTNFTTRSGFFYFPLVTAPVLTATAGDGQVALSWTAAAASLGFTVSGYQVGKATASAGPFTYSAVGNILSSTRTGLTNGASYYFVVRALDAFSSSIASSSIVSATPVASAGGGVSQSVGGSAPSVPATAADTGRILFTGQTAPGLTVVVLKNAVIIREAVANASGNFSISIEDMPAGPALFILYAKGEGSSRSSPLSVTATIIAGQTVQATDLLLSPIFTLDAGEVRQGENTLLAAQTAPETNVAVWLDGKKDFFFNVKTSREGSARFDIPTGGIPKGSYSVRTRAERDGQSSEWSFPQTLIVGDRTVPRWPGERCDGPADFNRDCRVNLIDFSILIYWFDRPRPPVNVDISRDGRVNLVDFSVLIYYWTG